MFVFQTQKNVASAFDSPLLGKKQREFQNIEALIPAFLAQNEAEIVKKHGEEGYRQISEELQKAKSVEEIYNILKKYRLYYGFFLKRISEISVSHELHELTLML